MVAEPPGEGAEARLRRDASSLLEAALAAVDPAMLVEEALAARPLGAGEGGRIIVVAVGKAAYGMAEGAHLGLGQEVAHGVVLAPVGSGGRTHPGFDAYSGGHPLPDEGGVEGARALADVARRAGPADRLLILLSGGGSALLTLPHGEVSLEDVRAVTALLLRSGAPIQELNAVRKHLDTLKGGGLAGLAKPARAGRRARDLSSPIAPPAALLAAGETTVVVTGDGRGGRNQELALGAALELDGIDRVLLLAAATDGVDGPTDAAGAVATGSTVRRARGAGLDPEGALERNDTYAIFDALGDLLITGPTGTNVMDLTIVLVAE